MRAGKTSLASIALPLFAAGAVALVPATIRSVPLSIGEPRQAQDRGPQADPRVDRTWIREWEKFAPFYLAYNDQYICFPTYSPDRQSSVEKSVETYIRETAYEVRYRDRQGRAQTFVISKPVEDAQAALWLLRDPHVGAYGYISCGYVSQIINERELILRFVRLIFGMEWSELRRQEMQEAREALRAMLISAPNRSRATQKSRTVAHPAARQRRDDLLSVSDVIGEALAYRFESRDEAIEYQQSEAFQSRHWHIIGFSTDNIVAEELWPQGAASLAGLHLAIVAVDEETITAVPAAWLERELTELQFLEVIESRGLTKAGFVDLVNQARREHRRDYIPAVLQAMEGIEDDPAENDDTDSSDGVNDTVELAD